MADKVVEVEIISLFFRPQIILFCTMCRSRFFRSIIIYFCLVEVFSQLQYQSFYLQDFFSTMEETHASPENLKKLFLRFAFFSQRDVHWIVSGSTTQCLGCFTAHHLDLLMQEGILPLQLLVTALHFGHFLLKYQYQNTLKEDYI